MRHARGFALVAAVFLLAILGTVGTMLVTLSSTQQQTGTLAILSAEAMQAARGGLEWARYQELGSASSPKAQNRVCDFSATTLTIGRATVAVSCSAQWFIEDGREVDVYLISSVATIGTFGSPDYVRRRLRSTLVLPAP